MPRKSMTYGVLPSQEEFEEAFEAEVTTITGRFLFENDPRVGTDALNSDQLWRELSYARRDWTDLPCDCGKGDGNHDGNEGCTPQDAGQWCSDVLGVLGFEWV